MRHCLVSQIRRFAGDRKGHFSLLFAAASLSIMLAAGLAIDFGRLTTSQAASRNAVDAAILSTARALLFGKVEPKDAREYLESYLEGTLGAEIGPGKEYQISKYVLDEVNEKISVDLTRDVPLSFMALAGRKSERTTASGSALYGINTTEVVMTFDVTGSMRGRKMKDLKVAALAGLDDLLSGSAASGKMRVATVPYAEGVNTGPLQQVVFVETEDTTGSPPAFNPARLVDPSIPPIGGNVAAPDLCSTERKGAGQFTDANPSGGKINRDYRLRRCPTSELIPLTADKDDLKAAVAKMNTGGGTGGHIGIQWAWYLMSPNWASYLPAGSEPAEYGGDVRKFAVIMTDGEFNVAYADIPKKASQYRQAAKSFQKARKLCASMKLKGIEIFTIGFALNNRDARRLMRDCASNDTDDVTYYFEAGNGDELKRVYKDIAVSIKQLRLVQ